MKTTIEKVLQNIVDEMQSELRIFDNVNDEFKDDMFYKDYTSTSYIIYLNTIAKVKEVLFRMSINKEESC